MKILIFGASGTVGSAVYRVLSAVDGYEVHGTFNKNKPSDFNEITWHKWDIADIPGLNEMLASVKPGLVISSLTGDFLQQSAAHRVMVDYLKTAGGRMIFVSTANVFDGDVGGNHTEAALPYPISQYGDFKKSCEEMILWGLGANSLVVRLPKIISADIVERVVQHVEKGNGFYTNLYFNFNTPENVADALKHCLETKKSGILHLVSRDYMSDDEMAKLTLAKAGLDMTYPALQFSADSFCTTLGCNDVSKLRQSSDGGFYLTMTCTDEGIVSQYGISCADAMGAKL